MTISGLTVAAAMPHGEHAAMAAGQLRRTLMMSQSVITATPWSRARWAFDVEGSLTILSSTITANTATAVPGYGGGVGAAEGVTIRSSTIVGGTGIRRRRDGPGRVRDDRRTTIAGNTSPGCDPSATGGLLVSGPGPFIIGQPLPNSVGNRITSST